MLFGKGLFVKTDLFFIVTYSTTEQKGNKKGKHILLMPTFV